MRGLSIGDLALASLVVWHKGTLGPGQNGLRPCYELIALVLCGGAQIEDRSISDLWSIPACASKKPTGHNAEKPVALMSKCLTTSGMGAQCCFDPFLGSGTTLIAAHQLGRRCYGLEIEPRYVDVICRRFLNITGESPVRESDGAHFADLIEREACDAKRAKT